jgi:flagellar hook assembly protein FlgD
VTATPTPDKELYLDQNFFNPDIQPLGMDIRVITAGQVKVSVYNLAGESVVKLLDRYENPGNYRVYWDGKNRNGAKVGNSLYFILIQSHDGHMIRQVIVLK